VVGVITETAGQAGDKAAVGSIIVTFEVEGAGNASEQKAHAKAAAPAPKVETPKPVVAAAPPKVEAPAPKASEPQKTAQPVLRGSVRWLRRPCASVPTNSV
jgi:2-oxoisovalerate dehydrogenase E2 component (dihydrolipoyl transacylase)